MPGPKFPFKNILIFALGTWFAGFILVIVIILLHLPYTPPVEQLEKYEPRLLTKLISSDGVVIKEFYTQRRVYVPLDQTPEYLVNAVIATEDRRFYSHWGVDLIRMFKALMVDISTLSAKQGASTITQQLARNLYFTQKQTVSRKLKELITALQIEMRYSKREILEMYLTQTYFGGGAYGAQAAAQRFFSKDIGELNLEECATLVAALKAPSRYAPIYDLQRSKQRRNLVLYNMYRWGYISLSQYRHSVSKPLTLNPSMGNEDIGIAPYFCEEIRQQLEAKQKVYDFDYYHDGLTIYTTLDSRLQAIAESAVAQELPNLDKKYRANLPPALADSIVERLPVQVAFIALEMGSGKVLALIGGRDFVKYKFDRAVQAVRQPGSVFKPFVYLTAVDNGYPPTFRLLNQDVVMIDGSGKRWAPPNYDHSRGGLTSLRDGLKHSLNLVTIRLVQEAVPPQKVVEYARRMGFTSSIDAVDAIALGSSGVIPLEAVTAFSVFGEGGVLMKPYMIERIEDRNGTVIEKNSSVRTEVISEQTAYMMTSLLRSVMNEGTGGSARWQYGFTRDAGGKTGTTNEYTDAWFIGFTPQLCAGVWVGLDDPAYSLGRGQSGSEAALPIWARFMKTTYDSLQLPEVRFLEPEGMVHLEICRDSYLIATQYCPKTFKELFIAKYAPTDSCKTHKGRKFSRYR